jgi:hypothetical protein
VEQTAGLSCLLVFGKKGMGLGGISASRSKISDASGSQSGGVS